MDGMQYVFFRREWKLIPFLRCRREKNRPIGLLPITLKERRWKVAWNKHFPASSFDKKVDFGGGLLSGYHSSFMRFSCVFTNSICISRHANCPPYTRYRATPSWVALHLSSSISQLTFFQDFYNFLPPSICEKWRYGITNLFIFVLNIIVKMRGDVWTTAKIIWIRKRL